MVQHNQIVLLDIYHPLEKYNILTGEIKLLQYVISKTVIIFFHWLNDIQYCTPKRQFFVYKA